MSTLVTSNISDGTTSVGTSYVVNGSAKAWVNFNATGTQTIRVSLNASSLTDGGVGISTINLTSSMASADFATTDGAAVNSSYSNAECSCYPTTASAMLFIGAETNVGYDKTIISVTVHGDLA